MTISFNRLLARRLVPAGVLCGLAWGACGAAAALEPLKSYDKFSSNTIAGALWPIAERSVQAHDGQLQVAQRQYGLASTNSGSTWSSLPMPVANPAGVTEISVKVTVTAIAAPACAANATLSESRARLLAVFFNSGTPVPGSSLGDVEGQIRVVRFSNSSDPAGTLAIAGYIVYCTSSNCEAANFSPSVDLGTVTLGESAVIEIQWDQLGKQILFSRDRGAYQGAVAYTVSDGQAPGYDLKGMDTRLDVANCVGSQAPAADIAAQFDNVMLNSSAIP